MALASPQAKALQLDYSSIAGGSMDFNGVAGTLSFSGSQQFQITSAGPSQGDYGTIGGLFMVGGLPANAHYAGLISIGGTLTIVDHANIPLVASFLDFIDINASGTSLALNLFGTPNLTGISYAGTESDLVELANDINQTITLSTTLLNSPYGSTPNLNQLFGGGQQYGNSAWGGQIVADTLSVPDGGMTVLLLGGALSTLGLIKRRLA